MFSQTKKNEKAVSCGMEISWSTICYSFDSAPMLRVRKCVHQQNFNNGLSIVLTYSI